MIYIFLAFDGYGNEIIIKRKRFIINYEKNIIKLL